MKNTRIESRLCRAAICVALGAAASVSAAQASPVLQVKNPHNAMAGVAPLAIPAFGKVAVKPGLVRGYAKDSSGKPLPGATIVVHSSGVGGFRTSVTTKTNAQGLYEIRVPVGICQVVNADYRVRYNERGYLLPLKAADGERDHFNSREGHVENFVLHTWGIANRDLAEQSPEYGEYYYGAHMRVQWFIGELPEDGTVEITLAPQGPLMGGSAGRTLVFRLPVKGRTERFLNNIPIGRYTMQAKLVRGGGGQPLQLEKLWSDEPGRSLIINFEGSNSVLASLDSSGIAQYNVMVKR